MKQMLLLLVFLVVVLGGGTAIGLATLPGDWYAGLAKPPFNPPNAIFGPVWTVLYVLIAVTGWRVARRAPLSPAMALWTLQLLLNFAWSPVFFGLQRPDAALAIVAAMLAAIGGFILVSWRQDRVAALMFAPYAAWVAFATVLNAAIVMLNAQH